MQALGRKNIIAIVGLAVAGALVLGGFVFAVAHLRSEGNVTSVKSRAAETTITVTVPTLTSLPSRFLVPTPAITTAVFAPVLQPLLNAVLANDKKTITLTFSKLDNVRRITYSVTYPTTTGDKGVNGSFDVPQPSAAPIIREVKLGTCSTGGNCTYDVVTGNLAVRAVFTPIFGTAVELTRTVAY